MGTFNIICPQCNVKFLWFSGNQLDQRCYDCKNPQKNKELKDMDYQQAHLDSLNKVIVVQNELIAFLKAEIERLKTASIFINPGVSPYPYYPGNPMPFIGSPTPLNPPDYTTTSGQTTTNISGTITSIGDPPGSISSGSTSSPPVPNWPETPESLKAKRKK